MRGMIRDFIQAARLRTLPLASACVLTGGALAAAAGTEQARFTPLFAGCLLTVVLLQVLANFANDLGDFTNCCPMPVAYRGNQSSNNSRSNMECGHMLLVDFDVRYETTSLHALRRSCTDRPSPSIHSHLVTSRSKHPSIEEAEPHFKK